MEGTFAVVAQHRIISEVFNPLFLQKMGRWRDSYFRGKARQLRTAGVCKHLSLRATAKWWVATVLPRARPFLRDGCMSQCLHPNEIPDAGRS